MIRSGPELSETRIRRRRPKAFGEFVIDTGHHTGCLQRAAAGPKRVRCHARAIDPIGDDTITGQLMDETVFAENIAVHALEHALDHGAGGLLAELGGNA